MHIASHAVKYLGFDPSRINILSFYNAQRDLLEKSMQKEKLKAVSVVSVDAMQGREADLIILSCVRADVTVGADTPPPRPPASFPLPPAPLPLLPWLTPSLPPPSQGGLGFVADKQRVNVALSRARECLVVVGHDKCLEVERIWQSALRGLRKFSGAKDFTNGIEEMLPKNCFAPRSGPMGPERAYDPKAERTSADREFEEDIKVAAAPQTIEQREEDIPDDWDADSD